MSSSALFAFAGGSGRAEPEAKPALTGGQALVATSEQIISASEKVRPAVVSIINLTNEALDQQEARINRTGTRLPYNASLGSGVIFKKADGKAYIITNAHVIQDAAEVPAVLVNGDKKEAKIIGKDHVTDLAVLEVDGDGIDTVVEIGDSGKLRAGKWSSRSAIRSDSAILSRKGSYPPRIGSFRYRLIRTAITIGSRK